MALKTTTLTCEPAGTCQEGVRLDVFIADNMPELTRSAVQKLLEAGRVTSNGLALKKNHRTSFGEVYIITQDEPLISSVIRQDIRLDVVYEDSDLIVINKPRGMVVHPAPGHKENTLVNALLYHCGDSLSGIGGVIRPGIVHRLDKDTSGLVIAAKNDKTHLSLASQFSTRTLTREYEAIVCGRLKNDSGSVDAPIGRHYKDRKKQAVHNTLTHARTAVTHYEIISRYKKHTHIRCRLETGRTHQIRVHMAYIGHPVLGDSIYGRKKPELGMSSHCLHAKKLCFLHPATGEHMELYVDLPDYFSDVLLKLERLC